MTGNEPSDPVGGRLRAVEANLRAGRLREAAAALDALAASAPSDWRVFLAGAAFARASGNAALEIESLQRAAALAGDQPRVQLELSKALSRAGRHEDAMPPAARAVELAPADLHTLEVAVAIADAAGELAAAQRYLETAHVLQPDDASIVRALARCLARRGRHAEAEPHWRAILGRNADDVMALEWLGSGLIELGRNDEALALLERLQALAPQSPGLPFHLALARGETPPVAPRQMTQEFFDDYAARFDRKLVGELRYRVPRRVAEIIRSRPGRVDSSILDLGCGTGLLGAYLGRIAGAFVGVDLSAKMLEQAARHGVYTELRHGELLEELRRTPAGSFDCVTANDVFIYVGDLREVVPAAFTVLRPGGAFIFSCETADDTEGAFVLRPSKRYAHSRGSVEASCRAAGFTLVAIEPLELRLENKTPIAGFIVVAEKR